MLFKIKIDWMVISVKQERTKTKLEECVTAVKYRLKRTQTEFEMVELLLSNKNIPSLTSRAFDFADAAERLALVARELPAYTGDPQAHRLMNEKILEIIPIRIGFTKENWFFVSIPALLPKKEKGSSAYIRDSLSPAMSRFFCGKNPVRYADCVLIFRHIYDRGRPERAYRDHDLVAPRQSGASTAATLISLR